MRSSLDPTRRSTHLQLPRPLRHSPRLPAGPRTLPQATSLARLGTPRRLAKRSLQKFRLRPTVMTVSTRSLVRPEAVVAAPVVVARARPAVADVVVDAVVPEAVAVTVRLAVVVAVVLAAMAMLPPGPRKPAEGPQALQSLQSLQSQLLSLRHQ